MSPRMKLLTSDSAGVTHVCLYSYSSGTYHPRYAEGFTWGTWTNKQYCKKGARICAIQTRVQKYTKSGDNVALDGVRFYCCANVVGVTVHLDPVFELAGGSGTGSYFTEQRQISVGLVSSSQIDQSTSFSIAASMSASIDYKIFSASLSVDTSFAQSAFSSTLSTRQSKTTKTTTWHLKFGDPLFVYQGRTVVKMSDGGSFEMAGEVLQQSSKKLKSTAIEVLKKTNE